MEYIILVVAVIIFINQNGRIAKLESLLRQGRTAANPISPQPVATNGVPVQNVPATIITPPSGVPASQPKQAVSDEEASGRILGRIGIGAVIIGMAFFLKYAFDNNWVGPAGRVAIGILIGTLFLILGQALLKKYLRYAELLMGGGLAILYISIFSSYALYHLVDPMIAFLGMILITGIGVALSVINETQSLSVIALSGGYLAPLLIGIINLGESLTFTYITILNIGIFGILLFKRWNNFVLFGLVGTWLIFSGWFISSYTPALLTPTLLFILVQFLVFTTSSVFRIIAEKAKATEIDYVVLTITALSFASICYDLLMPQYKHYVSLGAVLVAGFYMFIALLAYKENPEDRTINIFLPGLSVAFLTIAVPIEFSGSWIAAWWFVEALVLYILASTSSSRGFQIMGAIVYVLGLVDLFWYLITYVRPPSYVVFFNAPFIMLMMGVMTAYIIAFTYHRYGSITVEVQKNGTVAFIVLANILTLYALTSQVITYYELEQTGYQVINWSNTTVSILWALYAAFLTVIGFAKRFSAVRRMGLILFIITAFKVVVDVWSLGELYRIISFIVFGTIALAVSFLYVRYPERLKNIV